VVLSGNQMNITAPITTTQTITLFPSDPTTDILLVANTGNLAGIGIASAATDLVLTQAELNELLSGQTVYIGNSNLLNTIYVGDGSSTTVHLTGPTTVLSGTQITFKSPTTANNLIVDGDGSTTIINAPVTSTTSVEINDGVVVEGTQTITAQAGGITIQQPAGTVDGSEVPPAAATDNLTLDATQSIYVQGAVGSVAPLQNLTVDTTGGNVTFGAGVTLSANLNITQGETVSFDGRRQRDDHECRLRQF